MERIRYEEMAGMWEAVGYVPYAEQQPIHEALSKQHVVMIDGARVEKPRLVVLTGGIQSGKSRMAAMHCLGRWYADPIVWMVGNRYEDCSKEYEYLRQAGREMEAVKEASDAKNGPWELEWKQTGGVVKVLSSEDVTKLFGEAPNGIVMCEPGRQSYESFQVVMERSLLARAWVLLAGTMEGSLTSARWYADLARECEGDNAWGGVTMRLPTYANRKWYPLGEQDPAFQEAVKAVREADPVTGNDRVLERFYGVPRTPQGLVFPEFRYDTHVKAAAEYQEGADVFLWVDPGYFPSAYAVAWVQVVQGQVRIFDELYLHHLTNGQVISMVQNHQHFAKVKRVVLDVAAAAHAGAQDSSYEVWVEAMRGIPVVGQKVSIENGLARTHDKLLRSPITNAPWLIVHPRAKWTCWEFSEGYRLRERRSGMIGSDLPVDRNNHIMKAIAYGLIDLFGYTDVRHSLPKATVTVPAYDRDFMRQRALYAGGQR